LTHGTESGNREAAHGREEHSIDAQIAALQVIYPSLKIQAKSRATPKQRVIIWLAGAVIAALLPLIATAIYTAANKQPLGFYQVTAKGELLIISAVLMIAGLAELVLLFWRMPAGKELQLALLPLGIVLYLVGVAFWYGAVSSHLPTSKAPTGDWGLAYGSSAMFVIAAAVSSYCVWLAGAGE
jgi:hypothetical protein